MNWCFFCDSCLIPHLSLLDWTFWIDVCQNDGNMLASGGTDVNLKIFDKRESKIVQTFNEIHLGNIFLFNMKASAESQWWFEPIFSVKKFERLISTSIIVLWIHRKQNQCVIANYWHVLITLLITLGKEKVRVRSKFDL